MIDVLGINCYNESVKIVANDKHGRTLDERHIQKRKEVFF